jgi:hypothetical protein
VCGEPGLAAARIVSGGAQWIDAGDSHQLAQGVDRIENHGDATLHEFV